MYYHYHHTFLPFGIGWGIALLLLVPYFLPTIVAIVRKKSSAAGIFILNFFLGWTLIGWVGALVWSLTSDAPRTVIVNNPPPPPPVHPQGYTNVTVRKPSPTQQDKIDQLRQLKQLLDEGVLTEEEFNRQKAAILG
jgi:hypothetical protein